MCPVKRKSRRQLRYSVADTAALHTVPGRLRQAQRKEPFEPADRIALLERPAPARPGAPNRVRNRRALIHRLGRTHCHIIASEGSARLGSTSLETTGFSGEGITSAGFFLPVLWRSSTLASEGGGR
jgi:hypothetical protein